VHVLEISRHVVKSLQGESLRTAELEPDGLAADRRFGIRDEVTGKILTGRREPSLLLAAATLSSDGEPRIQLPDGRLLTGLGSTMNGTLSSWIRRDVALVDSSTSPPSEAEALEDPLDEDSTMMSWTMPAGRFVDLFPLLLVTTAALRAGAALHPAGNWHQRRFRPNMLIDAPGDDWAEDAWCGRRLRVGDAELTPVMPAVRCTMVTRPQDGLERDLDIFRTLSRHHGSTLGVWATVATPGALHVGDAVEVTAD